MDSLKLIVDQHSSADAKVALFRSLFRGREDVYPRRFESRKTGKSGYAPACANEWVRGVCEKPRIKCAECPNRQFLSPTERVIRWHLSGHDDAGQPFVAGVYPLLLDESCFLLAIDFDKEGWAEDARVFMETCEHLSVPGALERSRSGRGGHVWCFFDEAIPAALARRLGSYLLTESMARRPDMGFESYDRFFPSQDTLPRGGFGNLIALPLQKQAREHGNSVFVDAQLAPYPDQWAFLSTVRKLARAQIEAIAAEGERRGQIVGLRLPADDEDREPWRALPSRQPSVPLLEEDRPASLDLIIGNEIYIPKQGMGPGLRNQLLRLAAFQNPEFYKAQAMRLPTYGKPRIVSCAEDHAAYISLPRGCLEDLSGLLDSLRIPFALRDERCAGTPVEVRFHGTLRGDQQKAADALATHDTGVLAATTAFGKTVVAAWLIARRGVNTLVLVHRRQLLDQWVERLSTFLNLPASSIGRIGGGRTKATGRIDVAVIQSLVRKGVVDDRVGDYGHLIVDECHHLSAHSFEQVARRAKARFVLGLSATVTRKDGHQPIIFMQCGPARYRVDAKAQAALRPFRHSVIVRPTAFICNETDADKRIQFQSLYKALVDDAERNRTIVDDVLEVTAAGRSPLILTERHEHLEFLANRLSGRVRHLIVLRGGSGRKQREGIARQLAAIPAEEERVLLGTGRYVGEGFDDARLDTLFVTLPVSWRGTIAQYVGRLHRLAQGKRDVRVYDYADLNVRMLSRMFERRCLGYEALGYEIVLPASAIPGWPVDVPLPSDPLWKRDYAGSVRRLVRDGVDVPLAGLFMTAAQPIPADAEGVSRARSASEAFLYRRLKTLDGVRGRFRLNAELAIPFDGRGRMEVDLLCEEARIVIEVDGALHLGDADAYRRDRRKDRLLHEHGYAVLRFLAEDLAKDLETVLDVVLRALASADARPPLFPNGLDLEGGRRQ